jgi:hypothetical protein
MMTVALHFFSRYIRIAAKENTTLIFLGGEPLGKRRGLLGAIIFFKWFSPFIRKPLVFKIYMR